jgi:MarR-like DNA-binding transcriptional regulator SgrR of sgrS sRNA
MIDKRLLIVERYVENGGSSFKELSKTLDLSSRQLSRLLKIWNEKDCIDYTPASGRGGRMNISMKFNANDALLEEFLEQKENMTISEVEAYLNLPWHKDSIDKIQRIILSDINDLEGAPYNTTMLDFIFQVPENLHPIEVNEFFAVHLLTQLCDTLYILSSTGEIEYGLVAFDEWDGDDLHLYLKKDIRFSNGVTLTANHVKQSLELLTTSGKYTEHFQNIKEITVHSSFHLSLTISEQQHIIKYQLSQPITGIYIPIEDGYFIGTGAYVIRNKTAKSITLKANLNSHRPVPDIRKVYLLVNQTKVNQYYTDNFDEVYHFNLYMATNFILFNPLTDRYSKEERRLLLWMMSDTVFRAFDGKYVATYQLKSLQKPDKIDFSSIIAKGPIRALVTHRSQQHFDKIKEWLAEYNVKLEYIFLSDDMYFNEDISQYDADVVIMQENYHAFHPFKLFDLMTHCKFKDWFGQIDDFRQFYNGNIIHPSNGKSLKELDLKDDSFSEISQKLLEGLEQDYYLVYLYDLYRIVTLPSGFKSIHNPDDSILDYSKIINDAF